MGPCPTRRCQVAGVFRLHCDHDALNDSRGSARDDPHNQPRPAQRGRAIIPVHARGRTTRGLHSPGPVPLLPRARGHPRRPRRGGIPRPRTGAARGEGDERGACAAGHNARRGTCLPRLCAGEPRGLPDHVPIGHVRRGRTPGPSCGQPGCALPTTLAGHARIRDRRPTRGGHPVGLHSRPRDPRPGRPAGTRSR